MSDFEESHRIAGEAVRASHEPLRAKLDESVHAMTLRLPDGLYEVIRKRAFDERTSITSQVVVALREQFGTWGMGCDVCGKAHVEVSTPGGFRFCAKHGTQPPNS